MPISLEHLTPGIYLPEDNNLHGPDARLQVIEVYPHPTEKNMMEITYRLYWNDSTNGGSGSIQYDKDLKDEQFLWYPETYVINELAL